MSEHMGDNKKKDKSQNILSCVILIVVSFIIGIVLAIFAPNLFDGIDFYEIPLIFLAFFLSLPLHIILHEAGHLLGGLLSGYDFIMFRLFNTVWIKTDKGISKRRQQVLGLLGQALMMPPEDEDKPPFLLYHSSGFLVNLLTGILLIILGNLISNSTISLIVYSAAAAAILLFFVNAIPKMPNDGYNILIQLKNPEATTELTKMLRLYGELVRGTSFTELQDYIELNLVHSLENPNNVTFLTAQAAAYMEQFDFEQAREIYTRLWDQRDDLLEPHKPDVYLNYLFTLLMTEPKHGDITTLKESTVLQNYSKAKLSDVLKTRAAEALYLEGNFSLAKELLVEGRPMIAQAPTVAEENLEYQLYDYLDAEIVRLENES